MRMRRKSRFVVAALAICIMGAHAVVGSAQVVEACGPLANAYGPFDYRDPVARRQNLPIVLKWHFTTAVQTLSHGQSGTILGDLNYTLRAFPNEPFALQALAWYALKGGAFVEYNGIPSFDCYFKRAIEFAPDDPAVRVIYGNYLYRRGKVADAGREYDAAIKFAPQSPEISYDAGLFFADTGDLVRAKELARIAYAGGYPLPGLRMKIAAAEAAAVSKARRKSK